MAARPCSIHFSPCWKYKEKWVYLGNCENYSAKRERAIVDIIMRIYHGRWKRYSKTYKLSKKCILVKAIAVCILAVCILILCATTTAFIVVKISFFSLSTITTNIINTSKDNEADTSSDDNLLENCKGLF
jgi:hypothetical protein